MIGARREKHPVEPPGRAPAAGHEIELPLRARAEKHQAAVVEGAEHIVERNLNERHDAFASPDQGKNAIDSRF